MNFFFLITTLIILLSTIMVFLKTPINSTLCLCTILIFSILMLFLLNVEFMSYIFILVYVGGIVLLFLFVIIMLNLKLESANSTTSFKLLSGSSVLFLLVLKLQSFLTSCINVYPGIDLWDDQYIAIKKHHYLANDIFNFSYILYSHFFFYLLLIGIILLLAMLGVLILSLNSINNKTHQVLKKNKFIDFSIDLWWLPKGFELNYTYLPLENYVIFPLMIFFLSMLGISINKQKNFLILMLFFELMLFSLSFLVIVFSVNFYDPQGQIFSLFIMSIAVSESAIGLGILIALYRVNKKIHLDNFSTLRG